MLTLTPILAKLVWLISSSSLRHRLPAVVEYWKISFCPFLLRTPSEPLTQPLESSNALAALRSNLGHCRPCVKPGFCVGVCSVHSGPPSPRRATEMSVG